MNRSPAESKRELQSLFLFPGISEEVEWREPQALKSGAPQAAAEERAIEEDIERWDGLA